MLLRRAVSLSWLGHAGAFVSAPFRCVHAVYVALFHDGCCLSELISLSAWEPSAVCQAPVSPAC